MIRIVFDLIIIMNKSSFNSESVILLKKMAAKGLEFASQHKMKFCMFGATSTILLRYGYIIIKRRIQKQAPGPIGVPFFGFLPWTFFYKKLFWLKLCLDIHVVVSACSREHT